MPLPGLAPASGVTWPKPARLPNVIRKAGYGDAAYERLLSGLLSLSPGDRPTASEALCHPAFYFGVASALDFSAIPDPVEGLKEEVVVGTSPVSPVKEGCSVAPISICDTESRTETGFASSALPSSPASLSPSGSPLLEASAHFVFPSGNQDACKSSDDILRAFLEMDRSPNESNPSCYDAETQIDSLPSSPASQSPSGSPSLKASAQDVFSSSKEDYCHSSGDILGAFLDMDNVIDKYLPPC